VESGEELGGRERVGWRGGWRGSGSEWSVHCVCVERGAAGPCRVGGGTLVAQYLQYKPLPLIIPNLLILLCSGGLNISDGFL